MITRDNIKQLLSSMGFVQEDDVFIKKYPNIEYQLKVDIKSEHIFYKEAGITVGRDTTSNFSEPENFVVLECVNRLLTKGYNPMHIELEPHWKLGHTAKGGWADIWVRTYKEGVAMGTDEDKDSLLIIECKKQDQFESAWNDTKEDGAQLFSYLQQERATKFLCLYTCDLIDNAIVPNYYLVNVQDNDALLSNNENAESYQTATNNRQLYSVWHNTYACDYSTRGIFEKDIQPYQIGKNKYTVNDLIEVDNDSIKKKYNEFAVILRQHNVGAKENAFDKLVNLFLAKVVDETNNTDDLHFYWKGAAYDDDFQLQDRLQRLYRDGMKKFLGEDVTYIENVEIEKAFRRFNNDPDATKKTIMEYFRALKFFSDNDFSFISVHNEKLFRQNAVILRKVIKMLQDIRLKTSEVNQNQFLGDLFEGFLNKGVKQSEGQYFTPMPIVRFIVSALPLENIIKDSQEIPWAIDYACGAGHFLTEYAVRIKEFAKKHRPDIPLKDYYAHITGVEKEYRLSKVSKVSAFMYGHDDINIVYSDALIPHEEMKPNNYSVLVANPPYAVSGFLDTLTEQERSNYKLFNSSINIDKNNAIETFFMERAAQLMKSGGVAGIILPVSVLTKGGIYTKAREIILQNFDIVSLVEFGSGTFGKTGTNTVVMFLRRKETNTPDAEHYRNRVDSWFNLHDDADAVYQDENLLADYCAYCKYNLDDYKEFMGGTINDTMMQTEIIQTYHNSFFGNGRNAMKDVKDDAKTIRSKYVSRSKTRQFKALPSDEQKAETDRTFYNFVRIIEKNKVYFFILAKQVDTPVLLIKSPSTNTEMKKFLGYEWSDSKGHEGIQYLSVASGGNDNENDGEEEDDDTMQQIRGINGINTPLFNPVDLDDERKINTLIRKNFLGEDIEIPDELSEHISFKTLISMIDFSRTSFTKEFKTAVTINVEYQSKYPLFKLGTLCKEITAGGDKPANFSKEKTDLNRIPVYSNGVVNNGLLGFTDKASISEPCVTISARGTLGFCACHKEPFVPIVRLIVCIPKEDTKVEFLNLVLNNVEFVNEGASTPQLSVPKIKEYKIPNPPMDIQQKIVAECEALNKEVDKNKKSIIKLRHEIEEVIANVQGEQMNVKNVCIINELSINPLTEPDNSFIYIDIDAIENGTGLISINKKIIGKNAPSRARRKAKAKSTIISTVRPNLKGFAYIEEEIPNSIFSTGLAILNSKDVNILLDKMIYLNFMYNSLLMDQIKTAMPKGQYPSINMSDLELFSITVPPISIQQQIVSEIEVYEAKIAEANQIIESADGRKQAILDKYLK